MYALLAFGFLTVGSLLQSAEGNAYSSLEEVRRILNDPERLPLIVEKRRNAISEYYGSDEAELLWLDQARGEELTQLMEAAGQEGLRPEDYPHEVLVEASSSRSGQLTPSETAWVELLYTGHFLDFANDLRAGRVSPRVLYPDAYMPYNSIDGHDALQRLAASDDLDGFVESWQPQDDTYRRLKGHLQHLQSIRENGGFTYLEPGENLIAGQSDPRIPALRQRLHEGGLLAEATPNEIFDKRLAFAVAQAQHRYGLPPSAEVDAALIKALNIPVDRRIEQVANAMERIRWIPNEYARLQLFINKGENRFVFLEDGRVIREGAAYANCPDRNYATTATTIEAVTFHPTWRVSWEFFGKELLPRLQKDPREVEEAGYYLRRSGAEVPLDALPWNQATLRDLQKAPNREQYALFLPSSDENPLGDYAYRLRQEQRLSLFDLAEAPEGNTYCNPYLPKTAFGIVDGLDILEHIIEPRVFPEEGLSNRISRRDTITFPARGGLMAVVSHQSVWVQRQGIIRFGNDPYLEDARLTAALSGRPKP
ncbi:peptidoglycan-binding protein [Roseibium sp. SCP14]|uniref:peptidoglycan-binding protein n=1 Tax=Roseibium sp. SCP14 TaxID=3141375 RepID=UPI00333C2A86